MPAFLNTLALAKALGVHGTKWSAILRALRSDGVAFGESLLVIREIKSPKSRGYVLKTNNCRIENADSTHPCCSCFLCGVAFGESLSVIWEIKMSKKQSLFVLFFVLLRIIKTWGF